MKRTFHIIAFSILLFAAHLAWPTLRAQTAPAPVKKASAIQVMMIQSNEVKLPAEFQIAVYENLIEQLEKHGGFQHVYRDGDHAADGVADLVVFRSTVSGFKKGSEMARNVTTVAGKTSIEVHCLFQDKQGATILERDLRGNVRFFGGNLRATLDFAKKGAKLAHDNFAPNPVS